MSEPKLHFFCGLIASGKSTLSRRIAEETRAIRLVEDTWLDALWPGELNSLDDYRTRSGQLKSTLWPHVLDLLARDVTVVLDFPANNRAQRAAFRELISGGGQGDGHDHVLHHLDTPEAVCRARLAARNAAGEHPFEPSLEDFELFAKHFQPPAADEGFSVRTWTYEPAL